MSEVPLYTLTWAEVVARGEARETLVSMEGYLLCGRDRAFDLRYVRGHYETNVARAIARGLDVPPAVRQEYEERITRNGIAHDHARRAAFDPPPAKNVVLNAKGKPFTWSFTALTDYEGCPKRYSHGRFYCDAPFKETEQIIWGNRQHAAAEQYLKGQPVAEPDLLAPILKYANAFLAQRQKGAAVHAEYELALTEDLKPVSWFDKQAWYRGKYDVLVENGERLGYYDWKTGGKVKDDQDQLRISCAMLALVKPDAETFVPKLIWTKHETVTGITGGEMDRQACRDELEKTLGRVARMRKAWDTETFPARPSALCPWCSAYDKCEYARRR